MNRDSQNDALRAQLEAARKIIERGVELMPLEQLGKWEGVRAWQESETEHYAAPQVADQTGSGASVTSPVASPAAAAPRADLVRQLRSEKIESLQKWQECPEYWNYRRPANKLELEAAAALEASGPSEEEVSAAQRIYDSMDGKSSTDHLRCAAAVLRLAQGRKP